MLSKPPAPQVFFVVFAARDVGRSWSLSVLCSAILHAVVCDPYMELSYSGVCHVSYNSMSPSSFTTHGAGFTKTSLGGFNINIALKKSKLRVNIKTIVITYLFYGNVQQEKKYILRNKSCARKNQKGILDKSIEEPFLVLKRNS